MARLKDLVRRSAGSIRFLMPGPGTAQDIGESEAAIATTRPSGKIRGAGRNARRAGRAYRQLGRKEEASQEDKIVLKLLPP